jgi:DNA repair exonuclease SbcCD ATPase subunit
MADEGGDDPPAEQPAEGEVAGEPGDEAPEPAEEAAAENAPAEAGDEVPAEGGEAAAEDGGAGEIAAADEAAAEGAEEPAAAGEEVVAQADGEPGEEVPPADPDAPADETAADPEALPQEDSRGEVPEVEAEEDALAEREDSPAPDSPGALDGEDQFNEDGFEDGGEFYDEEEEEEDQVDPMIDLQEKYDQLVELNERAQTMNVALQRKVMQRKMQDKSYDPNEKQDGSRVTEHRYQNNLQTVHSVRLKLRLQQVKAARMSEELKNQLEQKRQKAIECRDSFQEFKRQVAKHAEYARTGKKIPERIIQEVEEFELDKDAEVEEVRGANISLKNRLAKLEQQLRKKDELAENLHVIDFEQLKIENQTLNEKIEERNEELHKLRKKTVDTVQIITHMREKVQFVQQEYQALKAELEQLDKHLASQRDLVTRTKHERDEHRTEYGKLKQQTGIINSDSLTKDFETRAEHIKKTKEEIGILKRKHTGMINFIKRHGGSV